MSAAHGALRRKAASRIDRLLALGFDRARVARDEYGEFYVRAGCSACEAACINGVAAHETGCSNAATAQRKCAGCDDWIPAGAGRFCVECN